MRNLVWSDRLGHWTALPEPGLRGPRSPEAGTLYVDDDGTVRFVASAMLSHADVARSASEEMNVERRTCGTNFWSDRAEMARNARAEIVAQYWLDQYMERVRSGDSTVAIATHPLGLVLAALNGETDPTELGVGGEARKRLEAMT